MSATLPPEPIINISPETWTKLKLHISATWQELTRDMKHAVAAAVDPKPEATESLIPIYVSAMEDAQAISSQLEKILTPEDFARIDVRPLPGAPEHIHDHGLLYLPGRYVVPGGRFNELYGWDSYFMALGLLKDGRVGLAQSVTEQCLYEVKHYGAVLNCNRTYCLTRSQPPYLSRLIMAVFEHTGDLAWLRESLPLVEQYHAYWQAPPHFIAGHGLSRYHAFGEGPAVEVLGGEVDEFGQNHYQRVCDTLRDHPNPEDWFSQMYDASTHSLTADGYKNDRTIRESGFDLTNRFGLCGLAARNYLPVCLNTLLWQMERDIAAMRRMLDSPPETIQRWETLAAERADRMSQLFWDEEAGLFQDFNLVSQERSTYAYITTLMPLWAGWASQAQAEKVVARLSDFMRLGGLLTSLETTGCQWDAPFSWAPLIFMASRGLRAYGFEKEAQDVAVRFMELAAAEFDRTGQLFEKYDVVNLTADVTGKISYGYPTNEVGFGWTNGVMAEFMADWDQMKMASAQSV